jgi:hypothetical protein
MCLIIFSQTGKLPPRDYFSQAATNNPDGIGVMSADGVAKFLGKRKARRAWRYVQQLSADGIPYGVHFRWATHGRINRSNCHPFEIPGTDSHMMHNGILWTSAFSTDEASDTRLFADEIAPKYVQERFATDFLSLIGREASGNRLLFMHGSGKEWDVVNRHLWTDIGGILYSNLYSFDVPGLATPGNSYPVATGRGLAGYGYSKPSFPSGPGLSAADAEEMEYAIASGRMSYDEADDAEESEAWDAWEEAYSQALRDGYGEHEAEALADEAGGLVLWRKDAARAAAPASPYARARAAGFDWQDSATWHLYAPDPDRVLNRHGDGEAEYGRPDPQDMFV